MVNNCLSNLWPFLFLSRLESFFTHPKLRYNRCLSGNTAEAIQKVDPQFIKAAKIEQSLTPGRNNGFLNMLKSMKQKALALDAAARSSGATATVDGESSTEATHHDGRGKR